MFKSFTQSDYNVGDKITYRAIGGENRTLIVEFKSEDIKDGRPGFDGTLVGADPDDMFSGVWGYDDQITRVY